MRQVSCIGIGSNYQLTGVVPAASPLGYRCISRECRDCTDHGRRVKALSPLGELFPVLLRKAGLMWPVPSRYGLAPGSSIVASKALVRLTGLAPAWIPCGEPPVLKTGADSKFRHRRILSVENGGVAPKPHTRFRRAPLTSSSVLEKNPSE